MLLYAGIHFVPYRVFVDVHSLAFDDICIGSNISTVHSERYPLWGMQGSVWSQVVKFEDQKMIETTIYRHSEQENGRVIFAYEPNTTSTSYQIRWDQPFLEVGTYGVNEWVSIYPLPFVEIKTFKDAKDFQFNVIECE